MSGTKRHPIHRPSRHRPFTAEVLRLFVELEHAPRRRGEAFKAKELELARLLGLDPPWISGNSVLDRSAAPCWPPSYVAHETWHECRRLREALLAAIGLAA
jgi:hypothetical protein